MNIDWNRKGFFLKYWIVLIITLVYLISIICYTLDLFQVFDFDDVNEFIIEDFLLKREGTLISIAAIFIGIYFSIFTLLLTVKSSSKIVRLGIKTYKELIVFLRNAFIGSFIYIIYAIVFPLKVYVDEIGIFKFSKELFLGVLVVYMLLSAFRVGITFIYIFKKDLNNLYENIEKENLEIEEQKEIIHKLRGFLEEYEIQEAQKKAKAINLATLFTNPKSDK